MKEVGFFLFCTASEQDLWPKQSITHWVTRTLSTDGDITLTTVPHLVSRLRICGAMYRLHVRPH